jgi:hypothetical protein
MSGEMEEAGRSSNPARFARLSRANRLALVEAFLFLAASSVAIALLPFRRTAQLISRAPTVRGAKPGGQDAVIARCRWAINAWADRVPWRAVCFQRGMALHLMLRRRGIRSVLQYGVAQDPCLGLRAHVWVDVAGRTVMGGEGVADFALVASFPPGK